MSEARRYAKSEKECRMVEEAGKAATSPRIALLEHLDSLDSDTALAGRR